MSFVPFVGADVAATLQAVERGAETMLRKADFSTSADGARCVAADPKFMQSYPTLWTFMTQDRWEDDTPRETCSMTIFVEHGVIKLMLRDKNQGKCLWAASPSFSRLFEVVEGLLSGKGADWRLDRRLESDKASRPRKGS